MAYVPCRTSWRIQQRFGAPCHCTTLLQPICSCFAAAGRRSATAAPLARSRLPQLHYARLDLQQHTRVRRQPGPSARGLCSWSLPHPTPCRLYNDTWLSVNHAARERSPAAGAAQATELGSGGRKATPGTGSQAAALPRHARGAACRRCRHDHLRRLHAVTQCELGAIGCMCGRRSAPLMCLLHPPWQDCRPGNPGGSRCSALPTTETLPCPGLLQSPPTPLPVALGMLFTNGVCPVLLALAPAFYRRHRTAVVLLVRTPRLLPAAPAAEPAHQCTEPGSKRHSGCSRCVSAAAECVPLLHRRRALPSCTARCTCGTRSAPGSEAPWAGRPCSSLWPTPREPWSPAGAPWAGSCPSPGTSWCRGCMSAWPAGAWPPPCAARQERCAATPASYRRSPCCWTGGLRLACKVGAGAWLGPWLVIEQRGRLAWQLQGVVATISSPAAQLQCWVVSIAVAAAFPPKLCLVCAQLAHHHAAAPRLPPRRPLHVMGGPPFLMPAPGACLALIVWTQVLVAFIVPTAVLLSLQHRRRARRSVATSAPSLPAAPAPVPLAAPAAAAPAPRAGRLRPPDPAPLAEDEWSIPAVSCFAAQMLWLLLRVTLQDASA